MAFTITQSLLVCIFVKCFLHAIFTVLLCFTIYLTLRSERKARYWIGISTIVVMYLLNTAHVGMILHQDIRDFGSGGAGKIPSAKAFAVFGLTQITLEYVIFVLADLLLLWRAYVLYQGRLLAVALPATLIVAMIITCFQWLGNYFQPMYTMEGDDLEELFVKLRSFKIRRLHLASVTICAITNATLTAMIASRLIYQQWSMRKQFGFTTLMFETLVIVESGALYTIGWLIYIVAFSLKHNSQAILLDSLSELAGIVPVLIIVSVALDISPASATREQDRTALEFAACPPRVSQDLDVALGDIQLGLEPDKSSSTPFGNSMEDFLKKGNP
ncbi:hypothetical protein ONZ45_g16673 [Pleurotus djamor]|nr:hypothetical protein ONZ45_g16673 [Pleurotus djamor]